VPDGPTLVAFAVATVALLLIPGPAVLYTVNRSVSDGRRVGLAAVAGLEVGDAIQAAAAAVGLSAVLATSATMFSVVKWAGALYLIVTGIRTLRHPPTPLELVSSGISVRRAFRQGIVVNALNPKTALFFLSIFPQFVDPSAGHVRAQSLVLGALFVVLATVFNSMYSLSASGLRDLLLRGRALPFIRRYVSGAFFVGLGISAAATGHAPSVTR
jgi:threonine/homoserine/homoserine lactone efflux protein